MSFVNLPVRYIRDSPAYMELFLAQGLCPELGFDALALDSLSPSWHRATAREFSEAGLACAVHLPFFDLHPGSLDRLAREVCRTRLLQAMDAAAPYAPVHFIAHLDYNALVYAQHREQWLQHSLETWNLVLDHAGNIPIFLENVHETGPEHHVDVLAELVRRPGMKIGACFDLGHWHSFGGGHGQDHLQQWLDALAPYPLHLHLHDNDGSGDQHLGLGLGTIPWERLWTWLAARCIPVSATFEPHTPADFFATRAYLTSHPGLPF